MFHDTLEAQVDGRRPAITVAFVVVISLSERWDTPLATYPRSLYTYNAVTKLSIDHKKPK